ncbi:MAG: hypothetical protein LBK27_06365 [Treponema sp.]|jgi:hypothetical protein|nr:hypothetical protein [Treponema sp.]
MSEMYDRTSYSVFIFDLPHLRGRELREAVRLKLVGMYPQTPDDKNIFMVKNGNKKWSYLVFVLTKTENRMLPLSTLFLNNFFLKKTGKAMYLEDSWVEFAAIENGGLLKTTVKKRDDSELFEYIKDNFGPDDDCIEVFCHDRDNTIFGGKQDNRRYTIHNIKHALKNIDIHAISLNRNLSPAIKRRRIGIAAATILIITGFTLFLQQYRARKDEQRIKQRLEQEEAERIGEERRKEAQKLAELQSAYHEITSQKKPAPFEMAIVISECLQLNTRILSATFNLGVFQLDGTTGNSLALLQNFEKHGLISGVRLHQVHPAYGRETFTLSGTIVPYIEQAQQDVPLKKQIVQLETLIEKESNNWEEPVAGPSEFGDTIKSLLAKWRCPVTGFQYLSGGDAIEIEYALRGTSDGFFSFLHEASKHPSWEIPMVQIRNLYPQNNMDVVFRIRANNEYFENKKKEGETAKFPEPFPMNNITRNYYVRPTQPTVAAGPPPETVRPAVLPPEKAEKAAWLEYIGMVSNNSGEPLAYVKNTRTGEILKLSVAETNNMRYTTLGNGSIHAYINGRLYEISRK